MHLLGPSGSRPASHQAPGSVAQVAPHVLHGAALLLRHVSVKSDGDLVRGGGGGKVAFNGTLAGGG